MKKIIALVLTVLMVTSVLITGISAARVSYVNTTTTEPVDTRTKYIKCDANGHFADESPVNGVTDNFTMKIVLKSSTEVFGSADLGEMVGWLDGSPLINMKAGTISFVGAPSTLNYTFADDTLYTIDFVVDGSTTVYVNGAEVGTIAKNMRAIVYGVFYRYLVNEVSFIQNGNAFVSVKADDYDDGDQCGWLADAEVITLGEFIPGSTTTEYYNKNEYDVHTDAQYDGKAYYACDEDHWPDGEAHEEVLYFYPDSDHGLFSGDYVGNVVLSVDLCALSDDAYIAYWACDGGFITFDMAAGTIGVGGANIALNTPWQVGEWHHVEAYSIYGSTITGNSALGSTNGCVMYVDGELLAANSACSIGDHAFAGRFVCGGFHNMGMDNLEYFAGAGANGVHGETLYSEDFDDGNFNKGGGSLGLILDKKISDAADQHYAHDLGMYYYTWADEEVPANEKFIKCGANGHFADESPVNGVTDNFTMRLVMKSSTTEFGSADLGEMVGWLDGSPLVNMKAGTISFVGAPSTLNYTFADDTLYTIDFVVDGSTTVYVNGAEVGTIAKNMRAIVYGVFYRYLVNEVSFIQNGNAFVSVKADDYDDGDQCGWLADAEVIVQSGTRASQAFVDLDGSDARWELDFMLDAATTDMQSYTGADPVFAVDTRASETVTSIDKYIKCGANGHFADESPVNGVTDNFTMRLVMKSSTTEFGSADLGEMVGWLDGSPLVNMKAGTISFVGAPSTLNYTFADDTLYTIDFVVDGSTTVYVNGAEVGTIAKNMRAIVYGVFYRYLVNEVSFIQNGNAFVSVKADDYDDGDQCGWLADAEVIVETKSETVNTGEIGYIGVGADTIPYAFEAGVWYHAIFDGTNGNGTDIYVNGIYVGNVPTTIKADWFAHPCKLSIDNLSINEYFEDFEDDQSLKLGDGAVVPYDFGDAPEPPEPEPQYDIFHWIETEEPGGTAYIVKDPVTGVPGYDYASCKDEETFPTNASTYFDMTSIASNKRDYVINLDLALIPEIDTTGDTYFEIWSDTATDRWTVGTNATGYRGGDNSEDLTAFDWGEATKDNFHNITWSFKNNVATMYVDGEQVYERATTNVWRTMMIGNVYNGTAIIDNVQLFTYKDIYDADQPNELVPVEINLGGEEDVRAIDLDAADFCAANCHIQYSTSRTTEPYCTTTGVDTTICAICGETARETTVPALGHNWPNYYNGVNKADGEWSWDCKRCGYTASTTVPDVDEGTLVLFADFEDPAVVQDIWDEFDAEGEVVANGVGHFEDGCGQNYNDFTIPNSCVNNVTVSFDANVIDTFDSNDTGSYGHTVFFWYGGESGIANEIGYDFDAQEFFARPWQSNNFTEVRTPYEFAPGWHNIQFKVLANGADFYAKFLVDGEEVFVFDGEDAEYNLPTAQTFLVIRDFGVEAEIDNFAVGTADLKFAEPIVPGDGDVNGDGHLDMKDIKMLRAIIAGSISLEELEPEELAAADMNGDGDINALDLVRMKKVIAGAPLD